MIEMAELIASPCGRRVVLAINNITEGQDIDGKACEGRELKDLNRARAYLAEAMDTPFCLHLPPICLHFASICLHFASILPPFCPY